MKKSKSKRRRESSQRPEQPTAVSTSYTTSWDLTRKHEYGFDNT
jgi:hypothetical protein